MYLYLDHLPTYLFIYRGMRKRGREETYQDINNNSDFFQENQITYVLFCAEQVTLFSKGL